MTDEELIELHKQYLEKHKKAFRVAFDALKECWPPKNDPEWFASKAYPVCADGFHETGEDPLAKGLLLAVYGYLDEMAVKLGGGENADSSVSV